jgi:PPOX class probable F420-dependent enzyme
VPVALDQLHELAAAAGHLAVVATTRRDGTIHASLVAAGVIDDPVSGEPSVGLVVGGDTVKLRHLRRTRRGAAVFQAGHRWVSVEGSARIVGPDDLDGGIGADEIPGVLRDVFVAAGGTHDDWAEYDRVMAAQRRTAVFIAAERVLGIS